MQHTAKVIRSIWSPWLWAAPLDSPCCRASRLSAARTRTAPPAAPRPSVGSFGRRSGAKTKKTASAIAAAAMPPRERVKKIVSASAGSAAAASARSATDLASAASWSSSGRPIAISAATAFQ